ncbi:hypothetical protein [Alteromonas sp. W364]|uniref:hypothetical protein n=1 Tax=Alteromonas sp. W364 TaxID=3075610 RepID=UPI002883E06C|nr:hypothetical protein [Alteromonas sp. W364]MDT0629504.1 hypothetical protein [Alteromonas sp. W364]
MIYIFGCNTRRQLIKYYKLRLNGHILEATFYEYWDADVFDSFISEVKVNLIRLQGQEWGSMTDLRPWKGGDNEFIFAARAELNRLVAAGSSHAAYIIKGNSPHLDVLNEVAPSLSGYKRKLFSTKGEAAEWLTKAGFKLPLESKEHCEQDK